MRIQKGSHLAPPFFAFNYQIGFSLVELMIVVAIIGLLSAIAIPNFQKFQARSRTTEAKLQLAAVYTAEASFFGTYTMYHTCLNYMGYDPRDFKSSRFYTVGFINDAAIHIDPYTAALSSDLSSVDCPQNLSATTDETFFEAGSGVGTSIADSSHLPATALSDQTTFSYTAGAAGVIHKGFTASNNSSAFTIDNNKRIGTVRIGY